jgi:N-acetylglucosamine repressor
LNLLRIEGKLSRVEILRKLNLSKATVSRVVNEIIEDKIIKETREGNAGENGGRRQILLDINSRDKFF